VTILDAPGKPGSMSIGVVTLSLVSGQNVALSSAEKLRTKGLDAEGDAGGSPRGTTLRRERSEP